jgi:hypothetical protein
LDWPPIGPDVAGYVKDNPAKDRWDDFVVSGNIDDLFADQTPEVTGATFSLSIVPSTRTVSKGAIAAYDVTVNAGVGFVDDVTLSVTGLPGGVTPTFAENPLGPDETTAMTIPTAAISVGTLSLKVVGTV